MKTKGLIILLVSVLCFTLLNSSAFIVMAETGSAPIAPGDSVSPTEGTSGPVTPSDSSDPSPVDPGIGPVEPVHHYASGWNWYSVVSHAHSTYSGYAGADDMLGDVNLLWPVGKILADLDSNINDGICNISDHVGESNVNMPWSSPAFTDTDSNGNGHYIIPIHGEEWGTKVDTNGNLIKDTETGHATIFGINEGNSDPILIRKVVSGGTNTIIPVYDILGNIYDPDSIKGNIEKATYDNLLSDAAARGALVWANHPCTGYSWLPKDKNWTIDANGDGDYYDAGDWFHGIEGRMIGTEVWTWSYSLNNCQKAIDWWQSLLVEGKRKVVGTAGSDFHTNTAAALLGPYMMAYAPSSSPEDVKTAISKGHIIMRKDQTSPDIILDADANGDGVFETLGGDTISVTTSKTIKFRVRCYGSSSGDQVRVYMKAGWVAPGKPNFLGIGWLSPSNGSWSYTFDKTFSAGVKDFVRVELKQSVLTAYAMDGMTNPIYINIY